MAQEAVSLHKGLKKAPPLLISVVVDEQAFKNRDAVNEYLDIISLWDVQGVYLIVRRTDSTYPASTDESVMANLMYFVYVLSEINGLEVVCGFSDMMGMLLHAAGATATGTGWYNSLKQFTLKRFQPSTGGRAPRARYTSGPLLGSLLIVPELDAAYRLKQVPKVISNTTFDGAFLTRNPGNVEWPASTACLHHWEVLSSLASEFSSQGSVSDNLDVLQEAIKKGIRTYQALERAGVQFELPTIPRDLRTWNTAIDAFRAEVGL
jgi:hypothetical protein